MLTKLLAYYIVYRSLTVAKMCVGSGFSFSIYELVEFMEISADVKIVSRLFMKSI